MKLISLYLFVSLAFLLRDIFVPFKKKRGDNMTVTVSNKMITLYLPVNTVNVFLAALSDATTRSDWSKTTS